MQGNLLHAFFLIIFHVLNLQATKQDELEDGTYKKQLADEITDILHGRKQLFDHAEGLGKFDDFDSLPIKSTLEQIVKKNAPYPCHEQLLDGALELTTSQCVRGQGTMDTIYERVEKIYGPGFLTCIIENRISKASFKKDVSTRVSRAHKNTICVRNSEHLFKFICMGEWLKDVPAETALARYAYSGVTLSDIKYFYGNCPLQSVTPPIAQNIGYMKAGKNKVSLNDVLKKYKKFKANDVTNAWNNCKLSSDQKKKVCQEKNYGTSYLPIQQTHFPNFDMAYIQQIYDKCTFEMSAYDKIILCTLKHIPFLVYDMKKKYTTKIVEDTLKKC